MILCNGANKYPSQVTNIFVLITSYRWRLLHWVLASGFSFLFCECWLLLLVKNEEIKNCMSAEFRFSFSWRLNSDQIQTLRRKCECVLICTAGTFFWLSLHALLHNKIMPLFRKKLFICSLCFHIFQSILHSISYSLVVASGHFPLLQYATQSRKFSRPIWVWIQFVKCVNCQTK